MAAVYILALALMFFTFQSLRLITAPTLDDHDPNLSMPLYTHHKLSNVTTANSALHLLPKASHTEPNNQNPYLAISSTVIHTKSSVIVSVASSTNTFSSATTFPTDTHRQQDSNMAPTPSESDSIPSPSNLIVSTNSARIAASNRHLDNVAIVIHTGKQVIDKRMPMQMYTFLKEFKNLLIVADYEGEFMGEPVVDVLDGLYDKTIERIAIAEGLKASRDSKVSGGSGWGGDGYKFIPGLQLVHEKFPDVDWYILIDDDVYLFLDPIMKQLSKLNPNDTHYLGKPYGMPVGACGETNPPPFAHGGTGIFVSKAAMKKFLKVADNCIVSYEGCYLGDVRTSLCFRDANIRLGENGNLNGMYSDQPNQDFNFDMDACEEPTAFHHLTAEQVQIFHRMNQKGSVTMADIYSKFKGPNITDIIRTDVDILGPLIYIHSNQNFVECQKQCVNDPKCVAWVGEDNNKCWLKKAPGKFEPRKGWVGGQVGERYQCTVKTQ
ncbi:UNVERIFIED_CONTAM: hypothetical protein HDU68_010592 [Siphonaria sp. JEL0065]|nr:hypothetical protein HDU68_010592 [Siphonaria sp. JEL0065]